MENTNNKKYCGCLSALLPIWMVGQVFLIVYNSIMGATYTKFPVSATILIVTSIVGIVGMALLLRFKKIGFYIVILASLVSIVMGVVASNQLKDNAAIRSIMGLAFFLILMSIKNKETKLNGYQTLGIIKTNSNAETSNSPEITISENEYQPAKKPETTVSETDENGSLKTIKLVQDGIEVSMSLPPNVIEQMEIIKKQDPQKWFNKEVELVKEAKKATRDKVEEATAICEETSKVVDDSKILSTEDKPSMIKSEVNDRAQTATIKTEEFQKDIVPQEVAIPVVSNEANNEFQTTTVETEKLREDVSPLASQEATVPIVSNREDTKKPEGLFGNKLESEFRRESKAESHWIRQDDTEICINIEEDVYRKMVELQSENPRKWVNKELDLFKKAKSLLIEQKTPKKSFFGRKKND